MSTSKSRPPIPPDPYSQRDPGDENDSPGVVERHPDGSPAVLDLMAALKAAMARGPEPIPQADGDARAWLPGNGAPLDALRAATPASKRPPQRPPV